MSKERHVIDETSRVFCAVRGKDVDVELCLGCRRLEDFDLDSRHPYIACRGPELGERRPSPARLAGGA